MSKWAIQTIDEIEPVYRETLPYFETERLFYFFGRFTIQTFLRKKRNKKKDYFKKEIVESIIFKGKITVKEPSHTMTDYLSEFFS
ncbi:MAG: hypothetical protein R3B55_00565 [Candidatus Paceibacterota bacterium]